MIWEILLATLLGSILSLVGGIAIFWKSTISIKKYTYYIVSFVVGVLLATVFFDLFPEAIELAEHPEDVFSYALCGIILFFLLERFVLWYHHHHETHGIVPSTTLLILGDTLHNFIDGVAIAGAFLASTQLGIVTTIAVAMHEIPQEIGEFGLLLSAGFSKKKTLLFNLLSSLSSVVGAVLTYFFASQTDAIVPVVLSFSAGMFLYIASSDLLPSLHKKMERKEALQQTFLFFGGILLMWITMKVFGHE